MRRSFIRSLSAMSIFFAVVFPVSLPGQNQGPGVQVISPPREGRLQRAHSFDGDLRSLPQMPAQKLAGPEFNTPALNPVPYPGAASPTQRSSALATAVQPVSGNPAPPAGKSFEGLDFTTWGAAHSGGASGDVGAQYYIQTINAAVGVYDKSDGSRVAAFTIHALMSQGDFGNPCDGANLGDPAVLYDTFEQRWILVDFAFGVSGGYFAAPAFQCFAVSRSGDPVGGGWNFYSIAVSGGIGDAPRIGIWPDGLYMSANIFSVGAAAFQNARAWAFNKAQMYAGNPTVQALWFDVPSPASTLLPGNARLQTGTPAAGSPDYFTAVGQFLNAVSVYKLHADWDNLSASTFSGPFVSLTATSWSKLPGADQADPSPGAKLDVQYPGPTGESQYTNIGGVEALWSSHTVGAAGASSAQSGVAYYQVNVTGGTVAAKATQAFTYSPDAAVRFLPSVAVDRTGSLAMGYSAASASLNPGIRYAGRLAGDPVNSITQTEQSLVEGTGTPSGNCGSSSCTPTGDHGAMTLDPDGCTFWYTGTYYKTTGVAFNTRIGAFSLPGCMTAGSGTLQGGVTAAPGGGPMQGASVALGSRTATTDINGSYAFTSLPAGSYPSMTASFPGYAPGTATAVVVHDGAITAQGFSLSLLDGPASPSSPLRPSARIQKGPATPHGQASASGCLTDTTQADFQAGVITNCDLTGSPGDVTLSAAPAIDQQNSDVTSNGFGFTSTSWAGQTFTPAVSGQLTRLDVSLFCSGCSGTTPDLTVSIRATTGATPVPTGADLATATITGFSDNTGAYFTANFSTPATLTAGTRYAFIFRAVSNPSAGVYAYVCSCTTSTNPYANGQRVTSANSGASWTADVTSGGRDLGFKIYVQSGFATSGTFVSGVKDANPDIGSSATWDTIAWTADTPAGTDVQFQAAASSDPAGPFSFVGPDGTSATFFTNGGSLAQFNGNRYLQYQASFTTSDTAATPALHDVTVCFTNVVTAVATTLAAASASGTFGGTADLSATLTANSTGVSGKTVNFMLNGSDAGSATTDGSGIATVLSASLSGINAGTYPSGVAATFAGDSGYAAGSGTASLTVALADQAITFGGLANKNFGDPDFAVSATASSSLPVTFSATGSCSVTGSTVHLTGAGSCAVTAAQAGNNNYNPAPDAPQSFSIAKSSQTITFGALSAKTFGDPDFALSATASSSLTVTFSATGSCSVTGSTVHLTGAGSCTITASQTGDSDYSAAPDVPQSFSIAKSSQTITFGALSAKAFGDPDFGLSATASSSLAVTFSATGNCSVSAVTVHLTGAGSCTITAAQAGDSNYNAAPGVPQSFSIAKGSQTITFGALSAKTFGDSDFALGATASSSLTVTFSATGSCSVTGSMVHLTGAGSCTITAAQAGDSNYNAAATVPRPLTINQALPVITVSCPAAGFDLNPHACTAAATGVGNATVSGATALTYNGNSAPPASAGTYSVNAAFSSSDSDYSDAEGSGALVIAKATPSVTVTCPSGVVYDGNAHSCTAAATGVGNATVSGSVVLTYGGGAAPSSAGTYVVNAAFTSSNSDYSNAAGIGSLTVAKAAQTITFGALSAKIFGDPDFTVAGSASSGLPVSFSGSGNCTVTASTVHLDGAGSCTVTASQAGGTNYSPAISVPRSFTIDPVPDFSITPMLPAITIKAGHSATDHITLTPNTTITALTFSCSGLPAKASCSFAPNPVPGGSAATDVILTITTTVTGIPAVEASRGGGRALYANWMGLSGIGLIGIVFAGIRRKGRKKASVLAFFSLILVLMTAGCGSDFDGKVAGTPPGTSIVTVTGSTTRVTHSTTLTLTVIN